jgi:uncharacterized membrane protein YebE (DUF533 family)
MPVMKANTTFIVSLVAAALSAGCASSGPSTERSAITGAALGAVGGAVLGNNVGGGGHHPFVGAALGAAAGGAAGAAIGNRRDRQNSTNYPTAATTDGNSSGTWLVREPPPAPTSQPQEAFPPQPSAGAMWIEGHYEYNGDGSTYQWIPGRWEFPPANAHTFVRSHWERRSDGYAWVRGYWE